MNQIEKSALHSLLLNLVRKIYGHIPNEIIHRLSKLDQYNLSAELNKPELSDIAQEHKDAYKMYFYLREFQNAKD